MPNCPSRYGGHWALLTGKALIFLRSHSFDSKFEVRTRRLSVINDESPLCGGAGGGLGQVRAPPTDRPMASSSRKDTLTARTPLLRWNSKYNSSKSQRGSKESLNKTAAAAAAAMARVEETNQRKKLRGVAASSPAPTPTPSQPLTYFTRFEVDVEVFPCQVDAQYHPNVDLYLSQQSGSRTRGRREFRSRVHLIYQYTEEARILS